MRLILQVQGHSPSLFKNRVNLSIMNFFYLKKTYSLNINYRAFDASLNFVPKVSASLSSP